MHLTIDTFGSRSSSLLSPWELVVARHKLQARTSQRTRSVNGEKVLVPPPGATLVIPPSAKAAGGSVSEIYMDQIQMMYPNKRDLKDQKGLSNCSGLFCPNIYLYQHYTVNEKLKSFDDEKGPFALGKIVQVPNHRKLVDTYKIKYHERHTETDGWVFEFPKNNKVKKWLQDGVQRANKISWRLVATKRNKIKKPVRKTKDVVVRNKDEGTILLSGILEEQTNVSKQIESDKSDNSHSSAEDDSDKESSCSSKSSGNDAVSERNNSVFDYDDDDGSQCNMDESAYYATTESNEKHVSGFDLTNEYPSNKETQGNDDDNENVYLGDEWQWNRWEPHNIDDDIEGPNKGD